VLRARGEDDDSTVKLRPAVLANKAARWRDIDGKAVELDVVGANQVPSVKVDQENIKDFKKRRRSPKALFSPEQKRLFKAYADGIKLGDLKSLGPVDARKWELDKPDGFPYELCIEHWSLKREKEFYELSFKVERDEAKAAHRKWVAFLERHKFDVKSPQEAKTPIVLRFFAERL
jgi:hypothetical protein